MNRQIIFSILYTWTKPYIVRGCTGIVRALISKITRLYESCQGSHFRKFENFFLRLVLWRICTDVWSNSFNLLLVMYFIWLFSLLVFFLKLKNIAFQLFNFSYYREIIFDLKKDKKDEWYSWFYRCLRYC